MNGFEKRATLIKEKIMKTTLEMLKTWDPKQIRIVDIAKMAKVSQVTIYNYFGSKEALISEVIKNFIDKSFQEFQEYMRGDYTFKEKIERIIIQDKESYHAFSADTLKLFIEDTELSHYVEDVYNKKGIPLLLQLFNDGQKSGEISSKISTESFLIYINMCIKYSSESLKIATDSSNPNFIDEMLHIFFYGLCGKP